MVTANKEAERSSREGGRRQGPQGSPRFKGRQRKKKAHERDGGGGNREAEAIPGVSTVPQVNKEASLDERSRATYNELLSSRKY